MRYSSYQIERLLERLRQWLGQPAPRRWHDPVRVSRRGATAAARLERTEPPPPLASLAAVRDRQRRPPAVEYEQERRAGSFLEPPYPETPAPPIPRARHRTGSRGKRRGSSERLADG